MIEGIDHVAIAVENLDEAIPFWRDRLGIAPLRRERIEGYGVEIATFRVGSTTIELVQGDPGTAVHRYVDRHGPGIHHLAFRVPDVEEALSWARKRGLEPTPDSPRPGKAGSRVAFLHPRTTGGILYELVEPGPEESPSTGSGPS
jgi:methylmalonyl-CoA/ethylmalonyl-CoA epimerase